MRGKVRHASDSIALHLDVRAEHLADERLQAAELDDEQLVLGCNTFSKRAKLFNIDTYY